MTEPARGNSLDARLRVVALVEARLRTDKVAWDTLWPASHTDAVAALIAALELIAGQLAPMDDPGAVLASWRTQLMQEGNQP